LQGKSKAALEAAAAMEKEEVIHSEAALTAAVKHAVDNIKVRPASN
jgi:hypothetical protein